MIMNNLCNSTKELSYCMCNINFYLYLYTFFTISLPHAFCYANVKPKTLHYISTVPSRPSVNPLQYILNGPQKIQKLRKPLVQWPQNQRGQTDTTHFHLEGAIVHLLRGPETQSLGKIIMYQGGSISEYLGI
jgi:hypothetical protein